MVNLEKDKPIFKPDTAAGENVETSVADGENLETGSAGNEDHQPDNDDGFDPDYDADAGGAGKNIDSSWDDVETGTGKGATW